MFERKRQSIVNGSDANLRNVHHVPVVGLVPRNRSMAVLPESVRVRAESVGRRRKRNEIVVDGVGAAVEAVLG